MNQEEMKHWLKRGFYAQKRAAVLEEIISNVREQAQGLSRNKTDASPSSDAGSGNRTELTLLKLADLEEKLIHERCRLAEIITEISGAILLLHDDDLEAVLESRYLLMRTAEQTAEVLHYDVRTVKYKQKRAVEKLCDVWRG